VNLNWGKRVMIYGVGSLGGQASDAAFSLQGIDEARLALANRVTGNETPEQLAAIQKLDKALELKRAQAQLNYDYHSAWFEHQQARRKKNRDQRQRLFEMGVIFG
jgi:hypothetical protein